MLFWSNTWGKQHRFYHECSKNLCEVLLQQEKTHCILFIQNIRLQTSHVRDTSHMLVKDWHNIYLVFTWTDIIIAPPVYYTSAKCQLPFLHKWHCMHYENGSFYHLESLVTVWLMCPAMHNWLWPRFPGMHPELTEKGGGYPINMEMGVIS